MNFHLTSLTSNTKLGLGVATSVADSATCPLACPMRNKECYARFGPLSIHWRKVSNGERGTNWAEFVQKVKALPLGWKFRYGQAGDLPSNDQKNIDNTKLQQLADVIKERQLKTWGYTHYNLTVRNTKAIKTAINKGFVINVSADTLQEADNAVAKGLPTTVVLPMNTANTTYTPAGNKVVVCPAQSKDNITCAECMLCHKANRSVIVGFLAHGTAKQSLSKKLNHE